MAQAKGSNIAVISIPYVANVQQKKIKCDKNAKIALTQGTKELYFDSVR
jgi:hypothetical protein